MPNKIINKNILGFTLLETLVALSILSISLGVTYQAFSTSLISSNVAEEYAEATMFADSHLASIGKKIHSLKGTTQGSYNDKYKWILIVKHLEQEKITVNLGSIHTYSVELIVSWANNDKTRNINISTYKLSRS